MKNKFLLICKKIFCKKKIVSVLCLFLPVLLLTFTSTCIPKKNISAGTEIAHLVNTNNKKEKFRYTYWRCEPIESRHDWLGWGIKTYLTALSNPWAVYGETKYNNCFLCTDYSLGQTFVKTTNISNSIPITVFANPSSRALSCFDFKLTNNKEIDTKYNFYCSKALSELLDDDLTCDLQVFSPSLKETKIQFDGVIDHFGYNFAQTLADRYKYFIVLPYMDKNTDEIISYNMQKYTGQSSFYSVLKDDQYENNFYGQMIHTIYSMDGLKRQTCYKATFIDNFENLFDSYSSIDSNVQNFYIKYLENGRIVSIGGLLIFIASCIICTIFIIICFKFKFLYLNKISIIFSSFIALIIYWIVGELFYLRKTSYLVFWNKENRIVAFLINALLIIILLFIKRLFDKIEISKTKKEKNEFCAIEI